MHLHTPFGIPTSKNIRDMHRTQAGRRDGLKDGRKDSAITTHVPGRVAQSATCLATDACLTADPGVASSIPVRSHTFVEIDHVN